MSEMLRVDRLTIDYARGARSASLVRDVSFSVTEGEAFTLIGETGSGKSLILQAIGGHLPSGLKISGRIRAAGASILPAHVSVRNLWGKDIFFIPQEASLALDPSMRILAQVREVPQFGNEFGSATSAFDAEYIARAKLAAVGLDPCLDGRHYPCTMSGGMNQRALIAMALASPAQLILVDEPTKNLDEARRGEVARLLRLLVDCGKTVVTVSHDLDLVRELGGTAAVMREGELIESGPVAELFSKPRESYTRQFLAALPEIAKGEWISTPTDKPCLTAEDLAFRFARKGPCLFKGVNLRIQPGEIFGVHGPSGVGKSTLGDVLLGLRRPCEGKVRWGESELYEGSAKVRRFLRPLYQKLYQDPASSFAPLQTIRQALTDVLVLRRLSQEHRPEWGEVEVIAQRLGLQPDLFERYPRQLSGGEMQRFAFLRVWMSRPRFVVADEPTSRLDPIVQKETAALLRTLAKEHATGVLLISHERKVINAIADQSLEINGIQ